MSAKRTEKPDQVVLKPLFGITPGRYLLYLYGALLLLILFLLFVLPGIVNSGTRVTFETAAHEAGVGAAVFIDERYAGSGNFTVFLPRGSHAVQADKPGYSEQNLDLAVKGRLFFSLFFPRKEHLVLIPEVKSLEQVLQYNLDQAYAWSFVTEYSGSYAYPGFFAALCADLSGSALNSSEREILSRYYRRAAALVSSPEMFEDYLLGAQLLQEHFGASPEGSWVSERDINLLRHYYAKTEEGERTETLSLPIAAVPSPAVFSEERNLTYEGTVYSYVEGGRFTNGSTQLGFPPRLDMLRTEHLLDDFLIASREVSERDFARFVSMEPFWSADNQDELVSLELADEFYLAGIDLKNPTDLPVRNISWHAAQAYCIWLTGRLRQAGYDKYTAQLPTEAQWEYAAAASGDMVRNTSLAVSPLFSPVPVNLTGNLWELTRDAYIPSGYALYQDYGQTLSETSTWKSVRGGAWNSRSESDLLYVRGSIPASAASEFIGFRPVLTAEGM
jgi:gamma-glutamyl hercynylcysteine S-oxide synthase